MNAVEMTVKPARYGLAHYNKNLRNVLMSSSSASATQAVRSQMFRASLVDNPFRGQNSLTKAIDTARHRDSNLKD